MDTNIPEEIQKKLNIIEKEADFSIKMSPPQKKLLFAGIFFFLYGIAMFFIGDKSSILSILYPLSGVVLIVGYFEYKKLFILHTNARDIINYYRNREEMNLNTTS